MTDQTQAQSDGASSRGRTESFEWVKSASTSRLLEILTAERDSDHGYNPYRGFRILNAAGVMRDAVNLVAEAGVFDDRDQELILSAAALQREVHEAAALLVRLWNPPESMAAEDRQTARRIASSIVGEIARQRVTVECGQLVRYLVDVSERELGQRTAELIEMFLRRFALGAEPANDGADHGWSFELRGQGRVLHERRGRPMRDIVLLHLALTGERCGDQAAAMLDLVIRAFNQPASVVALAEEFDHFAPKTGVLAERLLVVVQDHPEQAITFTCDLLANDRGPRDGLVESIAQRWPPKWMTRLCWRLLDIGAEHRALAVLDSAVGNCSTTRAAEVIDEWWHRDAPGKEKERSQLLDVAIRAGQPDPRTLQEIDEIVDHLKTIDEADSQPRVLLARHAALAIGRKRSGQDLVTLLYRIEAPKERRAVSSQLADRLAQQAGRGEVGADVVAGYMRALRSRGKSEALRAIDRAREALTDSGDCGAAVIAAVATDLWLDRMTRADARELLTRYLRRQQTVSGADVVTVLRALYDAGMAKEERHELLHNTVALWSAVHLDDALRSLRADDVLSADTEALRIRW